MKNVANKKCPVKAPNYKVIVALEVPPELKTASGIIMPQDLVERERKGADYGVVVDIGPECFRDFKEKWFKIGDTIGFPRYAGLDKKIDGVTYRSINDVEVCFVLEKENVSIEEPKNGSKKK